MSPRCTSASTALAGRDELAELRRELETAGRRAAPSASTPAANSPRSSTRLDTLAGHDELAALRERLDGLAGPDELAALREQLDALAARDEVAALAARSEQELAALRQRLDELGSPEDGGRRPEGARASRRTRWTRIAVVDRGAGTVLADVKSLREALALAQDAQESGRADGEELRELIARHGGELEVTRGQAGSAETEALGARQAAAAAGEAAHAAREDAARAREESAADAARGRRPARAHDAPDRAALRRPRGRREREDRRRPGAHAGGGARPSA